MPRRDARAGWGARGNSGGWRRSVLLAAALASSMLGSAWGVRQEALTRGLEAVLVSPEARGYRVGLWVKENTLLTPDGVEAAVAMARKVGADTLFVQVLARGAAAYRSDIWPRAASPSGPAFDPLAAVLQAAHRAPRLSVHAWVNVFTWGELGVTPEDGLHPLARHPDWVTLDASGRSLWTYRPREDERVNALFADPGLPGVRRTMLETVLEIVRRYEVDGIHLDYVRYPWAGAGYHPEALKAFWQWWAASAGGDGARQSRDAQGDPLAVRIPQRVGESGGRPRLPSTPEEQAGWNLFRANQVTALVEEVSRSLAREAPSVELTAAVFPEPRRAYEEELQEWPEWLSQRLLSGIVLMSYTASDQTFAGWVEGARRFAPDIPVYAGIGAYLLSGRPDGLERQTRLALQAGASGVVYFSFEALESDPALVEAAARAARLPSARRR
ncbi:MAG: family 10 glycosylhydrolase [Limnochordaceae bacterium]|nr:family 10 glycosylhydrolase [Limnochordaceae bacterium]